MPHDWYNPAVTTGHLRTPAAILETAMHVLAERSEATVGEIAAAAGVGRATFYRYYPTREALVAALADEAVDELAARIADARLERASVEDAIVRMLRVFLTVADRYIVVVRERVHLEKQAVEERLGAPILAVFARGIDEGVLRPDVGVEPLAHLFGSLVLGALETDMLGSLGLEQSAATLASLFLEGASGRTPRAATL